jgi:hypothetical protein
MPARKLPESQRRSIIHTFRIAPCDVAIFTEAMDRVGCKGISAFATLAIEAYAKAITGLTPPIGTIPPKSFRKAADIEEPF